MKEKRYYLGDELVIDICPNCEMEDGNHVAYILGSESETGHEVKDMITFEYVENLEMFEKTISLAEMCIAQKDN